MTHPGGLTMTHPGGLTMKFNKKALSIAAIVALGFTFGASNATAAQSGPWRLGVSCDAVTTEPGVIVNHRNPGTLSYRQHTTSPTSSTNVRMVNRNQPAQVTTSRTVRDNTSATWTNVTNSQWFPRFQRTGPTDCNGLLPGRGNYILNYTLTFNG